MNQIESAVSDADGPASTGGDELSSSLMNIPSADSAAAAAAAPEEKTDREAAAAKDCEAQKDQFNFLAKVQADLHTVLQTEFQLSDSLRGNHGEPELEDARKGDAEKEDRGPISGQSHFQCTKHCASCRCADCIK